MSLYTTPGCDYSDGESSQVWHPGSGGPKEGHLRHSEITKYLMLASLWLVLLTGCGHGPAGKTDPDERPAEPIAWPSENGKTHQRQGCSNLSGDATPGASLVFALTDSVAPGLAPIPHNPSERLVFAHLYETLINVDCQGNITGGLASAWSCTEDSTVWVFTIRRGARFWDGTHVTSRDVRDAWAANQGCPRRGDQTPLWTWFNARAKTIKLIDETRLAIQLPEPQSRFPLLLAHPATAISVKRDGWTWPVGSGPLRLRASSPAPMPDLDCLPNPHHPKDPIWKKLTFRVLPGADVRDLVSRDVDLCLTRRLDAVRFYQDMPGFSTATLPWNKLYLLVCPPEKKAVPWVELAKKLEPEKDLNLVAARHWDEIVFPAGGPSDCPQLTGPISRRNNANRDWNLGDANLDAQTIAYPMNDPAAKALAERMVALGADNLRAQGVHPDALDFLLGWQMAGSVILPSDQHFPTGCLQMATLLGRAAWLQAAAFRTEISPSHQAENLVQAENQNRTNQASPTVNLRDQQLVHPLALTHSWLITRGSWTGLELAFDGTPLLCNVGTDPTGGHLP
ncbi:MAG: hypothetical protein GY780_03205 [bacterium]|nr:hypothetical protein [bacterium]